MVKTRQNISLQQENIHLNKDIPYASKLLSFLFVTYGPNTYKVALLFQTLPHDASSLIL